MRGFSTNKDQAGSLSIGASASAWCAACIRHRHCSLSVYSGEADSTAGGGVRRRGWWGMPGVLVAQAEAPLLGLLQVLRRHLGRQLAEGVLQDGARDVGVAQPEEAPRCSGTRRRRGLCTPCARPDTALLSACILLLLRSAVAGDAKERGAGRRTHRSKSQMPCASSSLRVSGWAGRKWPSRPSVQSPGISQMRKKPRMWSIRYAWKYLRVKALIQGLLENKKNAPLLSSFEACPSMPRIGE